MDGRIIGLDRKAGVNGRGDQRKTKPLQMTWSGDGVWGGKKSEDRLHDWSCREESTSHEHVVYGIQ